MVNETEVIEFLETMLTYDVWIEMDGTSHRFTAADKEAIQSMVDFIGKYAYLAKEDKQSLYFDPEESKKNFRPNPKRHVELNITRDLSREHDMEIIEKSKHPSKVCNYCRDLCNEFYPIIDDDTKIGKLDMNNAVFLGCSDGNKHKAYIASIISVEGQELTTAKEKIRYCPMCGRKIATEETDG